MVTAHRRAGGNALNGAGSSDAFTQSPNGNFGFTFFIALKAEPDLKFNYNRQTFPRLGQSF